MNQTFVNNIFDLKIFDKDIALQLFRHQYEYNAVYKQWCRLMQANPSTVQHLHQIPFLPTSLFKTHTVTTGHFAPLVTFSSSGTTQTSTSYHYIKDIHIYKQSFLQAFRQFYGNVGEWCIIGLLPSYLERSGSSLVFMVNELIQQSGHIQSGFYLQDAEKLQQTLLHLESIGQKTLLIGVTFALLDFAEAYPMHLQHTVIMETGGMKGRKKELTREEVHAVLQKKLGVTTVHSEYGMTELLSQAYSQGNGLFRCPPWMKVMVRDEQNPLQVSGAGKGILNIIDLANIESCAFIATDDAGIVYENGDFEVLGRVDNSDIRGCSLLVM